MASDVAASHARWLADIAAAADARSLQDLRVALLGKKGALSQELRELGSLSPEERHTRGRTLNTIKKDLLAAFAQREQALQAQATEMQLQTSAVDVSLPADLQLGLRHPLTQTADEVNEIFFALGFGVEEGPDVETEWHNFTALNIPPLHPARQMHDTFYMRTNNKPNDNRPLLRTHTSPVQIRAMQNAKPPHRFIAPGRVYRCDSDQTHTPMFHQVEGLVIDRAIHAGHLRFVLAEFLHKFFGRDDMGLRFRPSYFPFTEPSFEVDVRYRRAADGTVRIGEGDAWMEVLGCGMVHPNVLRGVGVNPRRWSGFAFGAGLDRLAMLKYGIGDLRAMFEGDLRWLAHYGRAPFSWEPKL